METIKRFATFTEYEKWLAENKDKVQEYVRKNDVDFKVFKMPTYDYNVLLINGKRHMSDIIFLPFDEINSLNMMNEPLAKEINWFRTSYLRKHKKELINFVTGNTESQEYASENESVEEKEHIITEKFAPANETSSQNSLYYVKSLLSDTSTKEKIIEFAKVKNTEIGDFEISVRSYNALMRGKVRYLYEVISYYPDGFASFRNMGAKSIDEVCGIIENYVSEHYDQITAYMRGESIALEEPEIIDTRQETDAFDFTIPQLIIHPTYKEKARKYLMEHNVPVKQMELSKRSVNALMNSKIQSFYDVLSVYPDGLSSLRNIGKNSVDEIKARMEYYISKMQNAVSAYCNGEVSAMYSDEFVLDTVTFCFKNAGFNGISFKQICEAFSDEVEEIRIKKCIGRLLADKQLEYVDFRLYKVYPSFFTVIEETFLDSEEKEILLKRLSGLTLETIARELGFTRESIRQKINKTIKKIRAHLRTEYGTLTFDEDYYAYLYSYYEGTKEMWLDFLGVPETTFYYLANSQSEGKTQIDEALSDPKVNLILRFKIQNYLNRNKILLDGRLIEKRRSDIEEYALSKIAHDEISFDEFAERYNELLQQNGIDFDENLYYTDKIRRTCGNRLSGSMYCLWKQGERLRYYDIAGHDYGELLDTINLESFVNTEVSTLKFINDYPDVMAKYDIRDRYELHNLLKKVVDCDKYNDMSFSRQPMIQFGTFDRTQAIYDIIVAFSPITSDELIEYVVSEYGYDVTAAQNYMQPLRKYFHQGVYSVEFKRIPYDRIEVLEAELPDEFYYISEIKALYKKLFENADIEEINPRSLKALGYTVFSSYVLKNYTNADAYFKDVLNSKDVFSLKELSKRYGYCSAYTTVLYDMRKNYDILLFEENQCINFRKIEKLGITKNDIKEFCNEVYDLIDENQYFTIRSLQEFDINTKLESLGFDEIFLGGILAMSTKFLYTQIFGGIVLYKGQNVPGISKKSFILSQLSNYDDVGIDRFIDDCFDTFGIRIPDRYEITNAIANTSYYYDEIMDKVYRNKSIYYSEFED